MRRVAPLLLLAAAGCTGSILGEGEAGSPIASPGGGPTPAGTTPADGSSGCSDATRLPRMIRALNAAEYSNTIEASLPAAVVKDPFPISDRSAEFSTNAGIRRFDFNGARQVLQNAENVAGTAKTSLAGRFACLSSTVDKACVRQVVEGLGRELLHEPLTGPQVDKLAGLFERNQATGADEAFELVVSAMLSSPRFLFRKEVGQPAGKPGVFSLSSHEIASALAYSLTDAPPDAELRAAADADALRDPARIRSEALRLFALDRGLDGVQALVSELWGARNFMLTDKDEAAFPLLDSAARDELLADFRDTVALTLRSATPTLQALLTTRQLVVRPKSAAALGWTFSGLSDSGTSVTSSEPGRLGILTHPVIMATFAHQVESNPVARGHLVSDKLLCVDIPPPPQAVMFPVRSKDGVPRTLRQTLEAEHSISTCATCHQLMDPLGYPFEVFDGIGKLRATDAGLAIDSTGNIPASGDVGGPVANVEELMTRIAASESARACFAQHTLKYVGGVGDGPTASCVAETLGQVFRDKQGSIPELLVALLSSPAFLERVEAE